MSDILDYQWSLKDGYGKIKCVKCGLEFTPVKYRACQQRIKQLEEKYNDLILSVESIYENESRHETAKRYIVERENREPQPSQKPLEEK